MNMKKNSSLLFILCYYNSSLLFILCYYNSPVIPVPSPACLRFVFHLWVRVKIVWMLRTDRLFSSSMQHWLEVGMLGVVGTFLYTINLMICFFRIPSTRFVITREFLL
mgnify:CR=1 FL=1